MARGRGTAWTVAVGALATSLLLAPPGDRPAPPLVRAAPPEAPAGRPAPPGSRAEPPARQRTGSPPAVFPLAARASRTRVAAGSRARSVAGDGDVVAPEDTEPVVVELQIGRLASRTVQAYRVRTEVLVPLTQFFQLAEVLFRLSPEGRLEATLDPGRLRIVVDAERDTMLAGGHRVRLEPEFKIFRDGELYVGAERLGDLLDVSIIVDWSELTVTVMDPSRLPVALRLRREAARQAFLRRGEAVEAERHLGLERPRWDGLVFDYSVFTPSDDPLTGGAYTTAIGADALGGALELGLSSVGRLDRGTARLEGSWSGVWRDNSWIKQLRLGDGVSTGPRVRQLRGVSVTNAPFIRPSLVGAVRYRGSLEPGWTVEAYRGGDLVAYDSTDAGGAFAVDLPVRYGENPVDFVAYGPFGEVRQFNRTYRVLNELLPAGRFEYGASLGECTTATCDATANLDLRYGASRRWTAQAGVDQVWQDTLADAFHPYAAVTGTPTTEWAVAVEAVGQGYTQAGLRYEPSLNLRLEGSYTRFADSVRDPLIAPLGRRSQWSFLGFVRPSGASGYLFLQGSVDRVTTTAGTDTRAQLSGSFQAADVRLLPYLRVNRQASSRALAYVGLNSYFLPRPQWGRVFGAIWARSALEAERVQGLTSAAAFAGSNLSPAVRLEGGVSYQRGTPGVTYSLSLVTYLPSVRTITTIVAPTGQPVSGTQFVQGSVLYDRTSRRLALAPGPSLERSGLAGRVFLDENGNGVLDAAEHGIPGVRVLVGTHSAVSDSGGEYRVWDIIPFEPILVAVDSLTLESPLLVPAAATVSIVPGPNRFRALDLSIVQAGVIEGTVRGATGRGVGGVTLLLTERRTLARRTLVTFTDGAFYLLGVKPGDYELTVEPRVLDALGVTADPGRFSLTPGVEGVGRAGIEVLLRARR